MPLLLLSLPPRTPQPNGKTLRVEPAREEVWLAECCRFLVKAKEQKGKPCWRAVQGCCGRDFCPFAHPSEDEAMVGVKIQPIINSGGFRTNPFIRSCSELQFVKDAYDLVQRSHSTLS